MSKPTWKKRAMVLLAGGVLLQTGGCATTFAPILLSLAESAILTYLFGTGP
jgi:hypothetical protein